MKKIIAFLAMGVVVFMSCNKADRQTTPTPDAYAETAPTQRSCATYENHARLLQEDPSLQTRINAIEEFTKRFQNNPESFRLLPNGTLEVPVVVNVLWRIPQEDISLGQIQSQIDVLNEDFKASNNDISGTPSIFQEALAGDFKIKFVLQNVVRRQTSKKSWPINDAMKKTKQGGIDPTSPTTTLNMWSCNLGQNLLGYAQFPGGNPETDGVVVLYSAFGSRAKYPAGTYISTYDLGRTMTHEVGHYFNLRHIWGDSNCGNDLVDDTPLHNSYNFGCPAFPANSSCGASVHPMMTMNYMDYTDDACMFMFTGGQKTRVQATYAEGGPRAGLR